MKARIVLALLTLALASSGFLPRMRFTSPTQVSF